MRRLIPLCSKNRIITNFAPRVSFAYSPDFASGYGKRLFGDKETVIRGGFAVNYDVFFNNILGNTAAASPNVASTTILGRDGVTAGNPRGLNTFGINQLPTGATLNPLASITSIDPTLINPQSFVYNLGVQRRFFSDYILDVAYVGSRGLHLFINEQVNPFVGAARLNPSRGSVTLRTNGGDSNYNSVQARLERGFKNGYLMRATYTFSKTIDDVNSEVFATSGGTSVGSSPFNKQIDRSLADYDVPHVFTLTGLVNVPTFGTQGIVRRVLDGFLLSGIYRIQSGAVANPYVGGFDLNGDGNAFNDRPALVNQNAPANSVAISNDINGTSSATGYSDVNGNDISLSNVRYVVDENIRTGVAGRNTLRGPRFQRLDMFLMDEPLSNLDAKLRVQTRAELIKLHRRLGVTTIYVTHDQVEAMTMGQRIAVMRDGVLQQCDAPLKLYHQPANIFVAGFIGTPSMNFAPATVRFHEGAPVLDAGDFTVPLPAERAEALKAYDGKSVTFGIRPEDIHDKNFVPLSAKAVGEPITMQVEVVEPMGSTSVTFLRIGTQALTAQVDAASVAHEGQTLDVVLDAGAIHVFDTETEQAIM